MPRPQPETTDAPGHDSFLDIVANIVGILIILVMVTGVRAKNRPARAIQDELLETTAAALKQDQASEHSLRSDVFKATEQIRQVRLETIARHEQRMRLATAVALLEKEIEARRDQLSADQQEDFRLRSGLSEAKAKLERLQLQHEEVRTSESAPRVVESLPTPLSATVDGGEVHFQLRAGRVIHIRLDKLLERFKSDAQRKAYKLSDVPELTDTVGPEGGFRLRYTLERHDVSLETQLTTGHSGSYAKLKRWTLIPVSGQLGETLDEALAAGSRFRQALADRDPEETTITIWTYPDSFAEFRRLKQELFAQGFATAARPLPEGIPIGGSPDGSKSAAE